MSISASASSMCPLGLLGEPLNATASEALVSWLPRVRASRGAEASSRVRCLKPEIEFANQLVVVELIGRAAFEGDLADDDVSAVGDADRLVEVTAAA